MPSPVVQNQPEAQEDDRGEGQDEEELDGHGGTGAAGDGRPGVVPMLPHDYGPVGSAGVGADSPVPADPSVAGSS